ncbi:unnamed protein product [Phytophthora lilii]|uniref:Unnamed protein product n=1 Tax=Phytophthora lilii TaxID=2077276 RepID=A0A9W6XY77_9STRA|nr:unnamed protein product [Phytophthora lilii]
MSRALGLGGAVYATITLVQNAAEKNAAGGITTEGVGESDDRGRFVTSKAGAKSARNTSLDFETGNMWIWNLKGRYAGYSEFIANICQLEDGYVASSETEHEGEAFHDQVQSQSEGYIVLGEFSSIQQAVDFVDSYSSHRFKFFHNSARVDAKIS